MKILRVIAALSYLSISTASGLSQTARAAASVACGPDDIKFDAHQSDQHSSLSPRDGESAVYVFSMLNSTGMPGCEVVSRIGLDGKWIGANCGASYLFTNVSAGEHHLCADWQPSLFIRGPFGSRPLPFLTSFNAQAGKSYYFLARILYAKGISEIALDPVSGDEGQLLIANSPMSISKPKN